MAENGINAIIPMARFLQLELNKLNDRLKKKGASRISGQPQPECGPHKRAELRYHLVPDYRKWNFDPSYFPVRICSRQLTEI